MRRPSPQTSALLVTALAFHVDTLLYYLLVPLLPRYARELSLNPMEVGVLFGSYAVGLLLATFPVAVLTDRYGRRAPMLWGLRSRASWTSMSGQPLPSCWGPAWWPWTPLVGSSCCRGPSLSGGRAYPSGSCSPTP
ncbi:MAG: MFS transporter [Acidobacteria bacterium]|nr:MFS transporter [Acidobacteriota bacterium]